MRVTGYPRPSFTWYHNGSKVTTDHSLTLGEDGSLVILTAEMGHAGVYELEVANELGVDKRRVAIGVYGSEIELPGDYQMTVPAIPLAKFGPYVSKNHEKNNLGFNNQYRVSRCGCLHGNSRANLCMFFISLWSPVPNVPQLWPQVVKIKVLTDLLTLYPVSLGCNGLGMRDHVPHPHSSR